MKAVPRSCLPRTGLGDEQLRMWQSESPWGGGDGHTRRLSRGGGFWCLEAASVQAGMGEGAEVWNAEARGHSCNGRPGRGPPG